MAEYESHSPESLKIELTILVGKGRVEEALEMLNNLEGLKSHPNLFRQVDAFSREHAALQKDLKKNRISQRDFSINQKMISSRLMDILIDFEDYVNADELRVKKPAKKVAPEAGKTAKSPDEKILDKVKKGLKGLFNKAQAPLTPRFDPVGFWFFRWLEDGDEDIFAIELLPNGSIQGKEEIKTGAKLGVSLKVAKFVRLPLFIPVPDIKIRISGTWSLDEARGLLSLHLKLAQTMESFSAVIDVRERKNDSYYGAPPGRPAVTVILRPARHIKMT